MFKFAGRKRIKDRGINWKEHYGEKSLPLKKRMDKIMGPKSYFRWVGHDYTTNGEYFVIVGPAMTKTLQKRFFAGIKRLPNDPDKKVYAPSGKYFPTMISALSHARETWAVQMPDQPINYSLSDLEGVDIPRHIKGEDANKSIKTSESKSFNLSLKKIAEGLPGEPKPFEDPNKSVINGETVHITPQIKHKLFSVLKKFNTYSPNIPINEIFDALKSEGVIPIQEDGTPWTGMLSGEKECGEPDAKNQYAKIELAIKHGDTMKLIANSMLEMSWCKMQSGNFEISVRLT